MALTFAPPLLLAFGFLSAAQRGVWFVSLLLIVAYQKSTTAAAKSKGKGPAAAAAAAGGMIEPAREAARAAGAAA